jgi:hypothetical protein
LDELIPNISREEQSCTVRHSETAKAKALS